MSASIRFGSAIAPALAVGLLLLATTPVGSARKARQVQPPTDCVAPDRLEVLSRAYLGTPYRLDCLGEGTTSDSPDQDSLFTRKYVDCQTLVEQVMAEAVTPWTHDRDASVRLIRYRNSVVGLGNRYHYCIPDWLENPWPVRDATHWVAGPEIRRLSRTIDLQALLAARKLPLPGPAIAKRNVTTGYIARDSVRDLADRIPHGSIGALVLNRPGIVVGHVGFLFRKNGQVVFRHASQKKKRVIDENLLDYLAHAPKRMIGLKVLQPDMSGLFRGS